MLLVIDIGNTNTVLQISLPSPVAPATGRTDSGPPGGSLPVGGQAWGLGR